MESSNANASISHYRIVAKLGAGGMGEVYLAQDAKLDRKVALKILPADVASNQDRMERFVREAKSAAALNHPHIAQVFEIGEHDGAHFIAMEFIDGVSLRDKIHRERVQLKSLLKILQQVAEGLSKAHAAGIVHRDLKPDNIMITRDGFAKVLDFGLAKLVEKSGPALDQTEASNAPTNMMQQGSIAGLVMGTVGYMSPEQAQGKTSEIDQRSDIFSFGCILFEAITGKKAFEGDSVIKSLHGLIYEPAPLIKDLNPSAPADLQRIVGRCLEKDPDERYQTIKDVGIELKHVRRGMTDSIDARAGGSPSTSRQKSQYDSQDPSSNSSLQTEPAAAVSTQAPSIKAGIQRHKLIMLLSLVAVVAIVAFAAYRVGKKTDAAIESIAVMPFVNESGNPDLEYLSDGMTETLISSLSRLPRLNVKARSSVFRYKGREFELHKIAPELKVESILTGRVVQRGDQLTLSLELVAVQTENVIWSEQYNRKQADLVTLQSEIARDVSNKLRSKLSGADVESVERTYTANPEAYQLYLKGRFSWNRRTAESLKQSVEYYNQAIQRDPNYALAYSGLADSYVLFPNYSVASPQESMPKAKVAAVRAIEIDDSLAEAHSALGVYLSIYSWNQPAAEREFRRAIELDPNYPTAHQQLANQCLMAMLRFDESIAEGRRAEELDPLSPVIAMDVGANLTRARRLDEAIAQLNRALALDPNFYATRYALGTAYHAKGQYGEAIAEYRKALALTDDPWVKALLGRSLARSGQPGEARQMLAELQSESARRYVPSVGFALVFAALGEKDKAFVWLEKDVAERTPRPPLFSVNPVFDELRDDPRFQDLVHRVALSKID